MNAQPLNRSGGPDAGPPTTLVQTVDGPVEPDSLGMTLSHEHLIVEGWDHRETNYLNSAVMELAKYVAGGGRTIVDLSSIGLARDPMFVRDLARRSGVQVVLGTGFYKEGWLQPDQIALDEAAIESSILEELAIGIAGTTIRAGVIGEVGVSRQHTPFERRSLAGAARAQGQSGAGLVVHIEIGSSLDEVRDVLDVLETQGADMQRVAISHLVCAPASLELVEMVAARGCFVSFDLIGQERSGLTGDLIGLHPEVQVASVKGYLDRGLAAQMLLSQNVNHVQLLTVNGGDGYAHIARNVVARLRDYHVTEAQLGELLVDNPRRLLAPAS